MTAPARKWRRAELVAQIQALEDQINRNRVAKVAISPVSGEAGLFQWINPVSGSIIVPKVFAHITTGALSGQINIGVGTLTTSGDNLIDGADVSGAGAVGLFSNGASGGTNSKNGVLMTSGQYITGTLVATASGTGAALAGNIYIHYEPVDISIAGGGLDLSNL